MTAPDPLVVVDASAVLAYLFRERGGTTVERVLPYSVLPAPTLAEVVYKAAAKGFAGDGASLARDLGLLGVRVEPATLEDGLRAGELIAESQAAKSASGKSLSLGDGLCIAVAERLDLKMTGGDMHWAECDLRVEFHPFR